MEIKKALEFDDLPLELPEVKAIYQQMMVCRRWQGIMTGLIFQLMVRII